jgi:hypothetical protein
LISTDRKTPGERPAFSFVFKVLQCRNQRWLN